MLSCLPQMFRILTIAGSCAVAASAVLVSPDAIARGEEKPVPPKPAAEAKSREQLPRGVRMEKDIRYVPDGDEAQKLDLYLPEMPAERPLPLIVHIHGGGWRGGSKFPCPVVDMVSRGYAVASVEYRFSQKALFPAQIQDCQAAIRWLRANGERYGIDSDRFGAIGESAGGHLSALVGTAGGKRAFPAIGGNEDQSDQVQAVCDIYGPANFSTVVRQAADDKNVRCTISFTDQTDPYSQLIGTRLVGDKSM
jgi:acetyl esterase/lipase